MPKLMVTVVLAVFLMFPSLQVCTAENVPGKGASFPLITLPVPERDAEKVYLGLTREGSFTPSDIKADLLIIEIYSMYCPYCQKEAPIVNELYQAIEKKPDLKGRIKMIGIAAGNTPFEIDIFRNQYHVPFPLFSDESFVIHKTIGEVRTPHFFVLKNLSDGSHKIVYSKTGSISDAATFLDFILKESGLK